MTDIVERYRTLAESNDDRLVHQDHIEPLIAEIERLRGHEPTKENIDNLLERWDVTQPKLKREIFAAMMNQQHSEIERLRAENASLSSSSDELSKYACKLQEQHNDADTEIERLQEELDSKLDYPHKEIEYLRATVSAHREKFRLLLREMYPDPSYETAINTAMGQFDDARLAAEAAAKETNDE